MERRESDYQISICSDFRLIERAPFLRPHNFPRRFDRFSIYNNRDVIQFSSCAMSKTAQVVRALKSRYKEGIIPTYIFEYRVIEFKDTQRYANTSLRNLRYASYMVQVGRDKQLTFSRNFRHRIRNFRNFFALLLDRAILLHYYIKSDPAYFDPTYFKFNSIILFMGISFVD